jgi:two-component system sensor histidine kinase/response regulator
LKGDRGEQHMATSNDGVLPVILFVDDNPALQRSVECLLQMEGYEVMLALNGHEALQHLQAAAPPPDLIISDITMPGMDGFEFYKEMRKHSQWTDIPFIFLTARDQVEDLEQGYSLGADDYLVKPLDQDRLLWIVRGKLRRRDELRARIRAQEQELRKAKQDLATMVAHELRTPLVSITMVSDILAREMEILSADQVREMLDAMQSGQVRLHRLVEQMVMYVEMKSGVLATTVEAMKRPRCVHDVLSASLKHTQQMDYRQRGIRFRVEEDHPEVIVECDQNTLRQALSEIMLNAIAFSESDDEILVAQWASEKWTSIAITDRGPGIPEKELPRVFEAFYQVNRQWFEQQGVGIGLTLVKGIVELHGGVVEIQSKMGQGTQVTVTLPVQAGDGISGL